MYLLIKSGPIESSWISTSDTLKASTMSFGSQDGRSHPRVRRFEGDLCGSKWGVKINESAEDTVVLVSQFIGIGCRVLNQIEIC